MRKKTMPMRRRIRKARNDHYRKKINDFLRNPFPRRKLKEEEKVLRKHIKSDIRRQRWLNIIGFPARVAKKFNKSLKV